MRIRVPLVVVSSAVFCLALEGCASLQGLKALIQPPRFSQAPDHASEIRLVSLDASRPLGGATVRLWTTVENPNPFGFTLSALDVTLFLEDIQAAETSFPLGLPLQARGIETIPIDISISFSDVPRLAGPLREAARGQAVGYRLEGTVGIDAGRLGQPNFGPMTLLSGTLR